MHHPLLAIWGLTSTSWLVLWSVLAALTVAADGAAAYPLVECQAVAQVCNSIPVGTRAAGFRGHDRENCCGRSRCRRRRAHPRYRCVGKCGDRAAPRRRDRAGMGTIRRHTPDCPKGPTTGSPGDRTTGSPKRANHWKRPRWNRAKRRVWLPPRSGSPCPPLPCTT